LNKQEIEWKKEINKINGILK